jgi:hypothetical protein
MWWPMRRDEHRSHLASQGRTAKFNARSGVSLPFMAEQRRHNQGDSKSDEIDLGLQTFDKV